MNFSSNPNIFFKFQKVLLDYKRKVKFCRKEISKQNKKITFRINVNIFIFTFNFAEFCIDFDNYEN